MVSGTVPRNTPLLRPLQWSSDVQTWANLAVYSQTPVMWTPLGPRIGVLLQVSVWAFQRITDRY